MSKVLDVLKKHGKITDEQYGKAAAKETAKQDAKSKDLTKMSKSDLIALIEKVIK